MRGKRSKGDKKSAQGLPTHRLLGVLRLQRHIQELHHGTDGRIKAETFEPFRHLLEHDVELFLSLPCAPLAVRGGPCQGAVATPAAENGICLQYRYRSTLIPLPVGR